MTVNVSVSDVESKRPSPEYVATSVCLPNASVFVLKRVRAVNEDRVVDEGKADVTEWANVPSMV